MFETIVIPVDGSEYADSAAQRGFEIAAEHGSTVHVVCVADTGPLEDYRLPGQRETASDAISARAVSIVDAVEQRAPETVTVTTAIPTGPAKSEIPAYAESVGADLIVMGSRGRGGVERLMLGSVAEHVIRVSDVDVLVHGSGGD
jgi:nucleotide-binding universal stress UspA family protein